MLWPKVVSAVVVVDSRAGLLTGTLLAGRVVGVVVKDGSAMDEAGLLDTGVDSTVVKDAAVVVSGRVAGMLLTGAEEASTEDLIGVEVSTLLISEETGREALVVGSVVAWVVVAVSVRAEVKGVLVTGIEDSGAREVVVGIGVVVTAVVSTCLVVVSSAVVVSESLVVVLTVSERGAVVTAVVVSEIRLTGVVGSVVAERGVVVASVVGT